MTPSEAKHLEMTTSSVPGLVVRLAIPNIIAMLTGAAYSLADTYFVAQLGTGAAGAVGIVFALVAGVQAISFTFGIGASSLVSRQLGAKNQTAADATASTALAAALIAGIIISVLGMMFDEPLMRFLGATPGILDYALEYAGFIFFSTPFFCGSFVLNNLLRAEGKPMLSTIGIAIGAAVNVALDPVFIFTFKLGIAGAALATMLSQILGFCVLLSFFLSGRSLLRLSPGLVAFRFRAYWDIISIGLPSFFRQGLAAASTVILNLTAAGYGDSAVAAMSIVSRLFFLVLAILIGFGHGMQPVIGYNYGAEIFHRVRESFAFCLKTATVMLTATGCIGWLIAPSVIAGFGSGDGRLNSIAVMALRAQCAALPFQPMSVLANMLLQSSGKAVAASFVAATRQGIYFIPLLLVLPRFWGINGMIWTQLASDMLAFCSSIILVHLFFKDLQYSAKHKNKETRP